MTAVPILHEERFFNSRLKGGVNFKSVRSTKIAPQDFFNNPLAGGAFFFANLSAGRRTAPFRNDVTGNKGHTRNG